MLLKKKVKDLALTPDDPEWHYEHQEFCYTIEFLKPKLLRSTFMVSLYAVMESAMIKIAQLIQKTKCFPFSINELKGNFIERAKKILSSLKI